MRGVKLLTVRMPCDDEEVQRCTVRWRSEGGLYLSQALRFLRARATPMPRAPTKASRALATATQTVLNPVLASPLWGLDGEAGRKATNRFGGRHCWTWRGAIGQCCVGSDAFSAGPRLAFGRR